ncbi:MAG: tetratricopeptide repeat protein [Pseudomonadota bacterium]
MNPQLASLLSQSLDYLRASNLDAAEPLLLQALSIDSNNPDTLRFLGIIYAQRKDYPRAIKYLETAIKANPQNGIAHSNLGNVLFELGQFEKALLSYDQAIALNPTYAEAWSNKGNALYELGRYKEALVQHDRAIALNSTYVEAWSNKGNALYELELYEEALGHHDKALALNPSYAEAWSNKGLVLNALKDFPNALAHHDKALSLSPQSAKVWINKGLSHSAQEQHQEALALYDQALKLNPSLAEAWTNKGNAIYALGRYEESIEHHQKAIQLKPDYSQAWYNLGISYTALKRHQESIASYDQAIRLKSDYAMAYWNKSLVELTIGDFHHGWQNFEARAFIKNNPLKSTYNSIPRLQNLLDLKGKKILVWSEQGLGDSIQFCRYVPELARLGAELTFLTSATLMTLMESLDGDIQIVDKCNNLSDFDFQAPLMSLPLIFNTELTTIPSASAYLSPDLTRQSMWAKKLPSTRSLKVGLVWNGGFRPDQPEMWAINERRNMPLEIIARLQHLKNIEFYSLQKGDPAESELDRSKSTIWPTNNLLNFVPDLKDFSDTAALISNLDLVISVDTSTAHLAAALGKPTWILNRYDTCWRWLEDRVDSPWYSSVTLYRQKTSGDWGGVLDLVEKDLEALAQEHAQSI